MAQAALADVHKQVLVVLQADGSGEARVKTSARLGLEGTRDQLATCEALQGRNLYLSKSFSVISIHIEVSHSRTASFTQVVRELLFC